MKNKKSTNKEVEEKKFRIKTVSKYPLRERNFKETKEDEGKKSRIKTGIKYPLRERSFKETVVKSSTVLNLGKEKQKTRNFVLKDIKHKKNKKSTNDINSKENLVKTRSKTNVIKRGSAGSTVIPVKKNVSNIPIWKQYASTCKPSQCQKKSSSIDIYDIAQDEDISCEVVYTKKKRCFLNKNSRKKVLPTAKKTEKLGGKELLLKTKAKLNIKNAKSGTVRSAAVETVNPNQNTHVAYAIRDVKEKNPLQVPSDQDELGEIEHSILDQTQNYTNLSNLAEELEKSFQILQKSIPIPKMTSTPDPLNLKSGTQTQNSKISKAASISNITAINQQCLNATVETPSGSHNLINEAEKCDGEITLFESPKKQREKELLTSLKTSQDAGNAVRENEEGDGDITLFESPKKQEKKNPFSSPQKIEINLSENVVKTPSSINSSDDSVIMSRKAYHTPDNFKTHLIRAKRAAGRQQPTKKSKEDAFCEKMAEHFDEILDTELCIE